MKSSLPCCSCGDRKNFNRAILSFNLKTTSLGFISFNVFRSKTHFAGKTLRTGGGCVLSCAGERESAFIGEGLPGSCSCFLSVLYIRKYAFISKYTISGLVLVQTVLWLKEQVSCAGQNVISKNVLIRNQSFRFSSEKLLSNIIYPIWKTSVYYLVLYIRKTIENIWTGEFQQRFVSPTYLN